MWESWNSGLSDILWDPLQSGHSQSLTPGKVKPALLKWPLPAPNLPAQGTAATQKIFRHLSVTKTEEEGEDKPFPSWLAFVPTSKTHGFSVQNLKPLQSQKTNGLASSHYKVLQPGQLKLIFFSLNQIWMGKSMKRNGSQLHESSIFQLSVLNKSQRDVFPDKAISMVCLKPTSGVPVQFIFPSRPRLPMTNCYYSGNC